MGYSPKQYWMTFVAEVRDGQIVSQVDGKETVRVGVSTNPTKLIHNLNAQTRNELLVMLVAPTTSAKSSAFLQQLDDIRATGNWFFLDPLEGLLHKKIKEIGFNPHIHKKKSKSEDAEGGDRITVLEFA